MAPILSFTAEEVWGYLGRPVVASAQLAELPTPDPQRWSEIRSSWEPILGARETVSQAIEAARQGKTIVNPLEARVDLVAEDAAYESLVAMLAELPVIFKVSQVTLQRGLAIGEGVVATVSVASGTKCARCWLVKNDVGVEGEFPDLCGRCAAVVRTISADVK
jgi:isoleucyl-tRNA synthetase